MRKISIILLIILLGCFSGATVACATELISQGANLSSLVNYYNVPGNVSADGQYVVFWGSDYKMFIRDRSNGTTTQIPFSGYYPAISGDGRYIVYFQNQASKVAVCLYDKVTGVQTVVCNDTIGADDSRPTISSDGNIIAFSSTNSTYVPGDTNLKRDVFIYNRTTGIKERISISDSEAEANNESWGCSLSSDGRYVAFVSMATNLVGDPVGGWCVYVRDRLAGTTKLVSSDAGRGNPSISDDGGNVAFGSISASVVPNDSNGVNDIFIYNFQTGSVNRIVSTTGAEANQGCYSPVISGNGRYVIFTTAATNFDPLDGGYQDVYVYDRITLTTTRASISDNPGAAWSNCNYPEISYDGRFITYSTAGVAVTADTDTKNDVYLFQQSVDSDAPVTTVELSGTLKDNGWYVTDVLVQMSAVDYPVTGGSGVAKTEYKYSVNGNWITYTGSFTINTEGITTLYYRSIDNAGNIEATKLVDVKIDKTKPVSDVNNLTGVLEGDNWYKSNVDVALSASDNISGVNRTEYSFDNLVWNNYTSAFTISSEGTNNISYRSVDNAGNVEDTKQVQIMIDKTAPVTSYFLEGIIGNSGWFRSNVTVTLNAYESAQGSGVAQTVYSFNGVDWFTYNEPFVINTEGINKLYYKSVDGAGNWEVDKQIDIKIDKTGPVLLLESAEEGSQYSLFSPVNSKWTASDSVSGIAEGPVLVTPTFYEVFMSGNRNFMIYAEDSAGNRVTYMVSLTWTLQ